MFNSEQWLIIWFILEKLVVSLFCSPMLHLFDWKYSKNCEILLQFKIIIFYMNIC